MSATAASRDVPGIYHKAGSLRAERRWAMWTAYASLIFAAIIFLAPPFYMLLTSFKTNAEIADHSLNPWLIRSPTFEHYAAILGNPIFIRFFINSVIVTGCVGCADTAWSPCGRHVPSARP